MGKGGMKEEEEEEEQENLARKKDAMEEVSTMKGNGLTMVHIKRGLYYFCCYDVAL